MNAMPPHARAVRTTCPYCGVGCGIVASVDRQGAATVSGDPAHPANFGRLCSKGSALAETVSLEQRLLHPMLRQADGSLLRADWNTALTKVADGLRAILDRDGPDAIAFYLSGQLLTEDYYVANKLMKGFLGSANVDTNSRLCMASSVAGHRRAFGADTVPGIYRDFDEADLIVLVGSNAAWCHPILHQRMIAAKNERGARLVVIDPRRTATAEAADLFLPIAPGTDTALSVCWRISPTRAHSTHATSRNTPQALKRRLHDRARSPATRPQPHARPGSTCPTSSASSSCSGKRSASSPAIRKASTNRRKAPTR
jgi:assimilatory nitrate reductase catalytic subunit